MRGGATMGEPSSRLCMRVNGNFADAVGGDVRARVDGKHAGRAARAGDVDSRDARMRMRRASERHVRRALGVHVVGEAPLAREQARVLEPAQRLADPLAGAGLAGGEGGVCHGCLREAADSILRGWRLP